MSNPPLAVISDTHIGARTFNKTVFSKMMVYFETEFFPYLKKHNIKEVLHLGDLVHNRTLIDNDIDGQFKKRFFRWFEEQCIIFVFRTRNNNLFEVVIVFRIYYIFEKNELFGIV